jgi:hypothetical protein
MPSFSGKETCHINQKNQLAYHYRLPFMDNNKVYAIVCSNMTILEEGTTPFDDEAAAPPILPRDASMELRGSHVDPSPSGKIFTMDIAFCVSAGILALHEKGVYGQALIEKRGWYWLRGVPGDEINHFEGKQIGDFECFVQENDGKQFLIHCHKEDEYVCKVM